MMVRESLKQLSDIGKAFLNIVFPPVCLNCHVRIDNADKFLCESCTLKIEPITEKICSRCGSLVSEAGCESCVEHRWYFTKARSLFPYEGVLKELIHELKYKEMANIGRFLGDKAVSYIREKHYPEECDVVTAIPLHPVRQRERGYNQAGLLAATIAKEMDWLYQAKLIERKRYTATQTSLSRNEREANIRQAFRVQKNIDVKQKKILLIDDVFTTGATVNAASQILKDAGAEAVYVLTIGRA